MARKSELDAAIDKVSSEIEELEKVRARLVALKVGNATATTGRSHKKRKPASQNGTAPAAGDI